MILHVFPDGEGHTLSRECFCGVWVGTAPRDVTVVVHERQGPPPLLGYRLAVAPE